MRVQVDGGARGVLRHPVAVVDVVGHALRRLLVQQLPARQKKQPVAEIVNSMDHFLSTRWADSSVSDKYVGYLTSPTGNAHTLIRKHVLGPHDIIQQNL